MKRNATVSVRLPPKNFTEINDPRFSFYQGMKTDRKYRNLVRNLVIHSKSEDGLISEARVGEVLKALIESNTPHLKHILQLYRHAIAREIKNTTALVEFAGELGEESRQRIQEKLAEEYNRAITLSLKENPELIGGLRIRIGDDVIDHSVSGRLRRLASKI